MLSIYLIFCDHPHSYTVSNCMCTMMGVCLVSIVLSVLCHVPVSYGQHLDDFEDTSPKPEDLEGTSIHGFDLPPDLADFNEESSLFNPKGVIEGLILGDILQRIQNLEAFCEVNDKKFEKPAEIPFQPKFTTGGGDEINENYDENSEFVFPPDPFSSEYSSLTSKVEEVEATLQLLKESVDSSKQEQSRLRGDIGLVMEEVSTVQKQFAETRQEIVDTKEELLTAIMETNSVLTTQSKDISKLQTNSSLVSAALSNAQQNISHLNNLEMSVKQAIHSYGKTSRQVDSLARKTESLQLEVVQIKTILNQTHFTGSNGRISNETDRIITRLSNKLSGMKKRLKKVESAKCESGQVMFMNYPFSYGKWPQKREVRFAKPFVRRPVISLGITQLDVSYKYNTRAGVRVVKRSNLGFILTCDGWYNTRLYRVEVTWMACLV